MECRRKIHSGSLYIHAAQQSSVEVSLLGFLTSQKKNPNSFLNISRFKATIFIYMLKENKTEDGIAWEFQMQTPLCSNKLPCLQDSSTISLDESLMQQLHVNFI